MVSRRLIGVVLVGALTLAGCTSMKPIRLATSGEPPFGSLQAGDSVVVETRDGARTGFVVQQIDADTLIGSDGRRYLRSDLVSVERKEPSGPKTAGLIAVIAGGVFVVVAITVGVWLGENSR
jgi:hypothetical protein